MGCKVVDNYPPNVNQNLMRDLWDVVNDNKAYNVNAHTYYKVEGAIGASFISLRPFKFEHKLG